MAAGEFPLGLVYARRVESMKKSGAPIEWVKANRLSGRSEVEPLVQEMNPGKLKLTAIDPSVGEEWTRYSKEFREIYFQ